MSTQRGDDFEDDFVADDLIAESPEEELEIASSTEDEEDSPPTSGQTAGQPSSEGRAKAKKRKRREKEKEKKAKVLEHLTPRLWRSLILFRVSFM